MSTSGESAPGSARLLFETISQDLSAGKSTIIVDPQGDVTEELLRLLPGLIQLKVQREGVAGYYAICDEASRVAADFGLDVSVRTETVTGPQATSSGETDSETNSKSRGRARNVTDEGMGVHSEGEARAISRFRSISSGETMSETEAEVTGDEDEKDER
jgi:hypothetical protein